MFLKKIITNFFGLCGYEINKKNLEIKNLSFDEIYKIKIKSNPVIFDVGANQGQSIERFKKIFENPIIHAFEPIEVEFKKLKEKYSNNKNIILNNCAAGEKDQSKDFYITAKTGNSSFNKLRANTDWLKVRSKQFNTSEEGYTKEIKSTKVITLDNYCKNKKIEKIDILKIDTQGYEDKVLSGSQNLIQNEIKFIECEIMLDDVYEKHLNFSDIEKYLIPHDYRLTALSHHGGFRNIYKGHMFVVDVLYSKLK